MGIFDKNIHMNGAGTDYKAFLDIAGAAEEKGGKIGNRAVRLVKAGDGLATTTSSGTKGARATQIKDARDAFLNSIASEFGYAARSIAEKTLGDGVPLTVRSIRAVDEALGNKGELAADSTLVRENKADFDIETAFVGTQLAPRMGATKAELDRGRIQAEALRLIGKGKFANNKDGLRTAVREAAGKRVAAAIRLESLLRELGAPAHLTSRMAGTAIDKAVEIIDDPHIPDGEAVSGKLRELAAKCLQDGQYIIDQDKMAKNTVTTAKDLLSAMFGEPFLEEDDTRTALESLKGALAKLNKETFTNDEFKKRCETALSVEIKAFIMRKIGIEMTRTDSDNPVYGNIGVRLYDALGAGKGPKDRLVDDYHVWKMDSAAIDDRYKLNGKGPGDLRRLTYKMVFESILMDFTEKNLPVADAHPALATARIAIANTISPKFADRFATAATAEDFAELAKDCKAAISKELEHANATLKNIDAVEGQAREELEGMLGELTAKYGFPATQGVKDMFAKVFSEAKTAMQKKAPSAGKVVSAEECKAAIIDRVLKKWLEPCRQAAAEIDASALDPAHKKAFTAKVAENKIDIVHVRIALRTVPAFDAGPVAAAAKAGDGKKFAELVQGFISTTSEMPKGKEERDSVAGSDDYSAFVSTITELLFILNPEIPEGVRGLDGDGRAKFFGDADRTATLKSQEFQKNGDADIDKKQELLRAVAAKHWSSVTACVMQLYHTVG